MRQEHRGGEKLFIDYSDGLSIVDTLTGELTLTQLFVAVWGASNYTYAEAYAFPDSTGLDRLSRARFRVLRPRAAGGAGAGQPQERREPEPLEIRAGLEPYLH